MISTRLLQASASGNVKEVKKLISRGAIFIKDQNGNNALHEASRNGYADVVQVLLKANCFVDGYNSLGMTPLHIACQQGHVSVVKVLLKHKSNSLLANKHGETGLHIAAKYAHAEVVNAFAEGRANMNVMMETGDTALHVAAKYGNLNVLRALLVGGADPFIRNKEGLLPFETAEKCGHSEGKVLLECMMQDKYKDYRPTSVQQQMQQQRTDWKDSGEEVLTEGGKKQKSKFLSSFRAFSRFRRGSTSCSVDTVALEPSAPARDQGDGPNSTAGDGPSKTPQTMETPTGMKSEKRRSIQFAEAPRVLSRMYESVDDLTEERMQPVVRAIPPPLSNTPPPRKDFTEEYVTMAPSPTEWNSNNLVGQWNRTSNSHVPPQPKSILQMPTTPPTKLPTQTVPGAFDIHEELDTMRKAFEIRLSQLEKRYQRRQGEGLAGRFGCSGVERKPRPQTWTDPVDWEHKFQERTRLQRFPSEVSRRNPVGAADISSSHQTLHVTASSTYVGPESGEPRRSSVLYRRSGSADLLNDGEVPNLLQNQSMNVYSQSVDRISALSRVVPTAEPQTPMIDGFLSSDSDNSLIESVLEENIGSQVPTESSHMKKWFDADSSCDDGTSVCTSIVSMVENDNRGNRGNDLLKWIPREEARAKLKQKLKAHKMKIFQQIKSPTQVLGRDQPRPLLTPTCKQSTRVKVKDKHKNNGRTTLV